MGGQESLAWRRLRRLLAKLWREKAGREWLASRVPSAEGGKDLTELMVISFPDRFVRRKVDRQLAGIADSVEKRLYDLIENEYRGLSLDIDRAAVVLEVASALQKADLSDAAIFAADADPAVLAHGIRAAWPAKAGDLGEAGAYLYDVLLDECCDCLVRVMRQLPEFTPRAIAEILPRLSAIADRASAALDRLPVRTLDAPAGTQNDTEFERRYREHFGAGHLMRLSYSVSGWSTTGLEPRSVWHTSA